MKILFLSHYFPPEVNAPATRTYEHCKEWVDSGESVTVITCFPNCPNGIVYDGFKNKLYQKEIVDGINVIRLWTFIAPNKGYFKRIINYISYMFSVLIYSLIFCWKYDIIVATSPQFFCGWAGTLIHWFKRWPFILEIRDIWPESILSVETYKKSFLIRCMEWLEPRMYRSANHIVAVGGGYKQKIIERGIDSNKISVVTNGINLENFVNAEDKEALRKKYNSSDCYICSYIGTIGLAHGLEVILKAAKLLKTKNDFRFKFWIVGGGANKENLESYAKENKLENVVFTGMLPKEKMPDILNASDALLIHLKGSDLFSTVIPSKIFEAMAMNKPIIMGVKGGARDIVMAGNAGAEMEPDNPLSLIECLEELYCKNNKLNSREYVQKYFSRKKLAKKMLNILYAISQKK